ncbi:MAG: glutathione S-transferase family protein [Azospirillaceae bacterium]
MLTLYHAPQSRSTRIIWLLEEAGADYAIETVGIRRRDPDAERPDAPPIGARDPANPHPHGKVPALVHDGVLVYESSAIVAYLGDLFPEAGLAPPIGAPERGPYLSWLAYYAGTIEPAFVSAFLGVEESGPSVGWTSVAAVDAHIEAALAQGPYFLGERFSGVDVLIGSMLAFFVGSPLMPHSPALDGYVGRITARPAYGRAMRIDAGEDARDGEPAA